MPAIAVRTAHEMRPEYAIDRLAQTIYPLMVFSLIAFDKMHYDRGPVFLSQVEPSDNADNIALDAVRVNQEREGLDTEPAFLTVVLSHDMSGESLAPSNGSEEKAEHAL